jgi:hypothetical protein
VHGQQQTKRAPGDVGAAIAWGGGGANTTTASHPRTATHAARGKRAGSVRVRRESSNAHEQGVRPRLHGSRGEEVADAGLALRHLREDLADGLLLDGEIHVLIELDQPRLAVVVDNDHALDHGCRGKNRGAGGGSGGWLWTATATALATTAPQLMHLGENSGGCTTRHRCKVVKYYAYCNIAKNSFVVTLVVLALSSSFRMKSC